MTDLFEAEAATTTTLDLRRLQRNKRRATRRKWTLVAAAVALVVFAIGGSIAWNFLQGFKSNSTEIADYPGAGQGTVQVIVNSGDTGSDIATTLYDAGVVASRKAFLLEASSNPESQNIVPGYYLMHREMKATYALDFLLDPNNRDLRTITIPEGSTLDFYYQRIASITAVSKDDVATVAKDTRALGLPAEGNGSLEGWLFPSTYEFNPGVTPAEVLKRMIDTTVQKLDEAGVAEKDRLKILTIASLVEREAKLDEDRPKIASVIYNRLAVDMPLALDSTIKYFAPSEGPFTTADDRAIESPYNTYLNAGLPPGPIAGPGEASILAAVTPDETKYLFFVTVNPLTGETKYSKDYDTHLKYVKELQTWFKDNQSS